MDVTHACAYVNTYKGDNMIDKEQEREEWPKIVSSFMCLMNMYVTCTLCSLRIAVLEGIK